MPTTDIPDHCDNIIDDPTQPEVLRRYLGWARLPAICKYPPSKDPEKAKAMVGETYAPHLWMEAEPLLFADHQGKRVRIVMASRFGDVGITDKLRSDRGYSARVLVRDLSNFSDEP